MLRPSIRPRSRIREVLRKGRSSSTPNLVFKALPGSEGIRFGVVTTRRLGSAVVRNRTRRRIRECMAELGKNVSGQKGLDVMIITRAGAERIDSTELSAQIYQGMEELVR